MEFDCSVFENAKLFQSEICCIIKSFRGFNSLTITEKSFAPFLEVQSSSLNKLYEMCKLYKVFKNVPITATIMGEGEKSNCFSCYYCILREELSQLGEWCQVCMKKQNHTTTPAAHALLYVRVLQTDSMLTSVLARDVRGLVLMFWKENQSKNIIVNNNDEVLYYEIENFFAYYNCLFMVENNIVEVDAFEGSLLSQSLQTAQALILRLPQEIQQDFHEKLSNNNNNKFTDLTSNNNNNNKRVKLIAS